MRVFELAKELNVDSKRVLEVLETLKVDVKNHMSTIDQKTAEKVAEAVKRTPAKKAGGSQADAAKAERKTETTPKPVREANPAKSSLLEDYFGASTRPRQRVEDMKREMRRVPAEQRTPAERVAHAERPTPQGTAQVRPEAQAQAHEAPRAETVRPQPVVAQAPKEEKEKSAPAQPQAKGPAGEAAAQPAPAPGEAKGAAPAAKQGGDVGLPTKPAASGRTDRPAAEAGPRPAAKNGSSGVGLPIPASKVAARRAAEKAAAQATGERGSKPSGPRAGGGPRPGGPRGMGRRGALSIPKVDPKVAEAARPSERSKAGQGGSRKKSDIYAKRDVEESAPSEEKVFGRRAAKRSTPEERRVVKPVTIEGPMTVKDLAQAMGVTAAEVIKKLLTEFGVVATINQELDVDTCVLVANEFGAEVTVKEVEDVLAAYDQVEDPNEPDEVKKPRHPVVTIMGHVDHGKTSLLDAIRSSRVAQGEAGGITQHIGAYEVELNGKKITFLDTPGHEAFTAMRARGANVTDIAVLVVAADDSVMPQTVESINHARAANVPILVAINKIDKPEANPEKVKQDLTAYGLVPEEWGGDTIMVPVSAKTKQNLDLLLESILLLAELQDLKANPDKEARGWIIEAQLDKNRGPVATVLIRGGTLHVGDNFVAGTTWGRVRAMMDHRGRRIKAAGPSTPVQVLGFQSVPQAGDVFRVTPDEKTARTIAEKRLARAQAQRQGTKVMSLEDFMSEVAKGEMRDLNVVLKADVQGSVEAIRGQLEKMRNEEVQVKVIHAGVGAITETDVMLAATSKAIIIGFNVRPDDRASRAAQDQGVDIRLYGVIYDIVNDIEAAMKGMLTPKIEEEVLGRAEVRELFKVPKVGVAAGCMVVSGKVARGAKYRVIRDGKVVWDGELHSLRRFKDEVREVLEGFECGITLERFQDFKIGDILEAYVLKEVKAE